MKKAVFTIIMLMIISNAYAYPMQSVSIADDIINSVKDGITDIINAVIGVIKGLLSAVLDAITYPFKLLANNFEYSSRWWNSTLGGFSPIGYVVVIALTIGLIFWFVDKYIDIGLG
jgi:hypothetical protein